MLSFKSDYHNYQALLRPDHEESRVTSFIYFGTQSCCYESILFSLLPFLLPSFLPSLPSVPTLILRSFRVLDYSFPCYFKLSILSFLVGKIIWEKSENRQRFFFLFATTRGTRSGFKLLGYRSVWSCIFESELELNILSPCYSNSSNWIDSLFLFLFTRDWNLSSFYQV